ncbi:hypothetical protein HYV11_03500 [Candidatus Dependentiae bacterium]|nr:hypothetical protein [Candidatus Dependentiae bacterium]
MLDFELYELLCNVSSSVFMVSTTQEIFANVAPSAFATVAIFGYVLLIARELLVNKVSLPSIKMIGKFLCSLS